MRFIHTGDIHWGMIPDADKPWGKERTQAIKDTFRSIVDYAREKEADCLFIKRFKGSQLSLFYYTHSQDPAHRGKS